MTFDNYFDLRNVEPETGYYPMPKCFVNVLPKEKHAKILDIGCGFGFTLQDLKNLGYTNIRGVDILQSVVEYCKKKGLEVEKIGDIIRYSRKSKDKYDLVILNHVIEHIEKNKIIDTLIAIREYLIGHEGKLLIAVPNAQSNTNCYWAYEDFSRTTLFTAESLMYVLKAAGFTKIDFLDIDGLEDTKGVRKIIKRILLQYYRSQTRFWNRVTTS